MAANYKRPAGIAVAAAVTALAIVGGLLRLAYDLPKPVGIDSVTALSVATCLGPGQLPAGVPVRLVRLPAEGVPNLPPPLESLRYVAAEKVPFVAGDGALNALLAGTGAVELPAGTKVTVQKGEFVAEAGAVEIGREGGRHVLAATSPVRFRQADASSYDIIVDKLVIPAPAAGEARTLPAGSTGRLHLHPAAPAETGPRLQVQPTALVPVQPLATHIWVDGASPNIMPSRASGQKGLSDLAVEAQRPGIHFDAADVGLRGCAWTDSSGRLGFVPVSVTGTKARAPGAANITLAMPATLVPAFSGGYLPEPVRMVLVSGDGRYVGYGAFSIFDRGYAALIALFFALALLWGSLNIRQRYSTGTSKLGAWSAGLFLDSDRKASLSLFQIFFWTVITVWGLIYVYVVTGTLLSLTSSMLALLGIAGAGTVAARFTSSGGTAETPAQASTQEADFGALLSTNGEFDLLKLQLFIFTLLIGGYVVWRLVDTGAFPELDGNTLLLLGVSQGLYVGGKVASTTPLARARSAKLQLANKTEEVARLRREEGELNVSTLPQAEKETKLAEKTTAIAMAEKELTALKLELDTAIKALGLTP